MGLLFRSKRRHPDEAVRLRSVERTKDERVLVETACHDPSPAVRLAAVRRITDPGLLAEIVMKGEGLEARVEAVGRIQDQELLARILLEKKNYAIMKAAFEGITDPAILKRIAEDDRYNIAARRIAIENFADQSFLEEVATNVTTPGVREAALDRLPKGEPPPATSPEGPPENLERILERHGAERIVEALGKFRGSEKAIRSLGLVARKGSEGSARALHYLEKALEHSNPRIRACALEELSGNLPPDRIKELLEKALADPDAAVRETAGRIQQELPSA